VARLTKWDHRYIVWGIGIRPLLSILDGYGMSFKDGGSAQTDEWMDA
jgi:hypothetical protein